MNQVARTILAQIGGENKIKAMIGASKIVFNPNELIVKFTAKAKNGANNIRIKLDPSDTYTVEFAKFDAFAKVVWDVKATYSNVYAEDLKGLIESETGLYLSL